MYGPCNASHRARSSIFARFRSRCYFFFGPLPTVRLTFAPCLSVFPGFGFCASTWFLRALLEGRRMTMPGLQWAWAILTTALRSSIPTTFGTWHLGTLAKPAVTEWFALIVSMQAPMPEQSPDQPVNFEPAAGASVRVTAVPSLKFTGW